MPFFAYRGYYFSAAVFCLCLLGSRCQKFGFEATQIFDFHSPIQENDSVSMNVQYSKPTFLNLYEPLLKMTMMLQTDSIVHRVEKTQYKRALIF